VVVGGERRLCESILLEPEGGSIGDNDTAWRGEMLSMVMSCCFFRRRRLLAEGGLGVGMFIVGMMVCCC
jgi:hypothetical protein